MANLFDEMLADLEREEARRSADPFGSSSQPDNLFDVYFKSPAPAPVAPKPSLWSDTIRPAISTIGEASMAPFKGLGALATRGLETIQGVPEEQSRVRLDDHSLFGFTSPTLEQLAIEEGIKRPAAAIGASIDESDPARRAMLQTLGAIPGAATLAPLVGGPRVEIPERTVDDQVIPRPLRQAEAVAEPLAELAVGLPVAGGVFKGLGGLSPKLAAVAGGAFAPEMLASGAEGISEARRIAAERGWSDPEALRAAVGGAGGVAFGALGALHGAQGLRGALATKRSPIPQPEAVRAPGVAEPGAVGAPGPRMGEPDTFSQLLAEIDDTNPTVIPKNLPPPVELPQGFAQPDVWQGGIPPGFEAPTTPTEGLLTDVGSVAGEPRLAGGPGVRLSPAARAAGERAAFEEAAPVPLTPEVIPTPISSVPPDIDALIAARMARLGAQEPVNAPALGAAPDPLTAALEASLANPPGQPRLAVSPRIEAPSRGENVGTPAEVPTVRVTPEVTPEVAPEAGVPPGRPMPDVGLDKGSVVWVQKPDGTWVRGELAAQGSPTLREDGKEYFLVTFPGSHSRGSGVPRDRIRFGGEPSEAGRIVPGEGTPVQPEPLSTERGQQGISDRLPGAQPGETPVQPTLEAERQAVVDETARRLEQPGRAPSIAPGEAPKGVHPLDENGVPIPPQFAHLGSAERAGIMAAADAYADDIARLTRDVPPRERTVAGDLTTPPEYRDQITVNAVRSHLRGTPLEPLMGKYTPKQIAEALKRDKNNKIEQEVLALVAEDPRAQQYAEDWQRAHRGHREQDVLRQNVQQFIEDNPNATREEIIAEAKRLRAFAAEETARADTDALTKLGSRGAFDREIASHKGGVASMDAAGLGWLNDTLGHAAGDEFMRVAGAVVNGALDRHPGVRAFRYGGDELFLLGPNKEAVSRAAQDIQQNFANSTLFFETPDGNVLAFRGGRIDYGAAEGARARIRADKALYEARELARQRGERAARKGDQPPGFREVPAPGYEAPADRTAAPAPEALGEPKFATEEAAPALPGITTATVKRAFAAGDVREAGEGAWEVSLPGDRKVTVRVRPDGIEYDASAFSKGYGREKGAAEEIVGSWQKVGRGGIVALAKHADEPTLLHESFHSAMDLALSPKEKAAVLKKYGSEEAAAEAYGKWNPAKNIEGYFSKILAFFRNLYRTFRPSWESAFERTRSGEAYGARPTEGRPMRGPEAEAYATRPAPGQRGLPGIGEDVAQPTERKRGPEQMGMFGGEMLQGVERRGTEGREAEGPLFTQEAEARAKAEREAQGTLPKYATAPAQPPQVTPQAQRPELREVPRPEREPLGRPMLAGEAPRVETKVGELREVAPTVRLSRDAPRTWESLDPAIRAKLDDVLASPEREEAFYNKVRSGRINDVEMQAMDAIRAGKREAFLKSSEDVKAARLAGKDTPAGDVALLEKALDDVAAAYAKAARSDVEAGTKVARALAARARVMKAAEVGNDPDVLLRKVFREIEGITDDQASGLLRVLRESPDHLGDALNAAMQPKTLSKWLELWKAGLVSAPGTQIANILGNVGEQGFRVGETATAALVDKLLPGTKQRFSGEAKAEVGGAFSRLGDAGSALAKDLRDIVTLAPEKIDLRLPLERQVGAIGGKSGRAVRIPFRLLGAFDNFFKAVGGDAELAKLAYRKAGGNKVKARQIIAEALDANDPKHADLLAQVAKSRQDRTFQAEPGPLMRSLMQLRANNPWMHVVMPFLQTPANIADLTIQRSPFGFFAAKKAYSKWQDAVKAGKSAEEIANLRGQAVDAIARPLLGTALLGTFAAYAKAGGMTGSGPTDTRQKNLLRESGWQPYSFVVKGPDGKNLYVPFNRFEPISSLLGFAADLAEIQDQKKGEDVISKALGSIAQNLTSKTYLQGVSDAVEFIHRPEEAGAQYVSSLAGSLVPNIIAKGAQAIDPTLRETRGTTSGLVGLPQAIGRRVASRIPGLSQTLPERRSGTGERIERPGSALSRFASPVQSSEDRPERALERMLVDLDAAPSSPSRDLTIPGSKGKKVRLTDAEYAVMQDADKKATDNLRQLVKSPAFKRMDPEKQRNFIRRYYDDAGRAARERLYRRPDFMRRARAALREAS